MFLEREFERYENKGVTPEAAEVAAIETQEAGSTQPGWSSATSLGSAPLNLGPFRFVDLLRIWDIGALSVVFLLISDGGRQAVAMAARSVYEPFKRQIDASETVERLALIRHLGMVPWRRELLPQVLADFVLEVNGGPVLLKVSLMQLRGSAWLGKTRGPRPPRIDELGPFPAKRQPSPFALPLTFEAERPPQFAPVAYSDDDLDTDLASSDDGGANAGKPRPSGAQPDEPQLDEPQRDEPSTPQGLSLDANLKNLIIFGVEQGIGISQSDYVRPEVLSQGPFSQSQLPSQIHAPMEASQRTASTSELHYPGNISSDARSVPSSDLSSWIEAEESALMHAVESEGPNWEKILKLHGLHGSVDTALKAKSAPELSAKASRLKRDMIKSASGLYPGFEHIPLFSEASQAVPHKRIKLNSEYSDFESQSQPVLSRVHSDSLSLSPPEPALEAAPEPIPDSIPNSEPETGPETDSESESAPESAPESEVESIQESPLASDSEAESESKPGLELDSRPESVPDSQLDAADYSLSRIASSSQDRDAAPESVSQESIFGSSQNEDEGGPEDHQAQSQSQSQPQSQPQSQAQAQPEAEAEAESEAEAEAEAEPEPDSNSQSQPQSQPKPQSLSQTQSSFDTDSAGRSCAIM